MRPTPRQKSPIAPAPSGQPRGGAARRTGGAPRRTKAPRPAKAPRPKAPKPAKASRPPATGRAAAPRPRPAAPAPRAPKAARAAAPSGGSRPAFLERVGAAPRPAPPSASSGRERRQRHQRGQALRVALVAVGVVAALALVALVALFALRDSPVFSIDAVEAEPTGHVTQTDIQNLVKVPAGSTLLNVDTDAIEASLRKDPWVAGVSFERSFPHTLKISITEQQIDALVVMNTGSVAWYLGDADIWIQPTKIEAAEGQSVNDAALAQALADGCLLVTDVPATVSPVAGSVATDEVLSAVAAFQDGFTEEFSSQIVSYSAASPDSVTCTLKNGVEVLLGSPTDIAAKETVVQRTLEQHPGAVTYINVRVVTDPAVRPTVRLVDSDNVEAGDGVSAAAPEEGQATGDSQATADSQAGDGAQADDGGTGDATASDADEAGSAGAADGDEAGAEGPVDAGADAGA